MGTHPPDLRRVVCALGVLVVLVAPARPASAATPESTRPFEHDASWIFQSSSLEAVGIRARLNAPELRPAAHRHRSVPIWADMMGLGLALALLVPRGRLTLMAWRPHPWRLWPPDLPRGPPRLRFS